ncbi:MAG: alcohol dehydrogenase catalytic domain-containing protein [Chloroflexota bacterium]
MKALVFEAPSRLAIHDRPDPTVGAGEVLVAVRAAGICGSDVHGYVGASGRRRPGIVMGHEAAGEVVAAGEGVSAFRAGDRVALRSVLACGACEACRAGRRNLCHRRRGLGMDLDGAYADAVSVPEALAVSLPSSLSYEEGALVEPLAVALHAVDLTPMPTGADVAIVGAGAIGLLTLLAARLAGAGTIRITDRSRHRLEVASSLGADETVLVPSAAGGDADERRADVVFEAVGSSDSARQSLAMVRPGGDVTWIGNAAPTVEIGMQDVVTREVTLRGSYAYDREFDLAVAALAAGRIDVRPLIERIAPLESGPAVFADLAAGRLDAAKVILVPGT